jgi:hypothetical protein
MVTTDADEKLDEIKSSIKALNKSLSDLPQTWGYDDYNDQAKSNITESHILVLQIIKLLIR